MEETLRAQLLDLCTRYEAACGATPQTVGKRALNDNRVLLRIRDGGGFTVATFDKLVAWLSEHWPEATEWPEAVERPKADLPLSA